VKGKRKGKEYAIKEKDKDIVTKELDKIGGTWGQREMMERERERYTIDNGYN